jgi:hypothetical protein
MRKRPIGVLCLTLLTLAFSLFSPKEVAADSQSQETPPTPAEVIQAVNQLRIAHGLLPLNTHPVLMQVAQWEANAIAGGADPAENMRGVPAKRRRDDGAGRYTPCYLILEKG